jgi:hypothetical protein
MYFPSIVGLMFLVIHATFIYFRIIFVFGISVEDMCREYVYVVNISQTINIPAKAI